jgi:hypothetical protein
MSALEIIGLIHVGLWVVAGVLYALGEIKVDIDIQP